MKLSRRAVLGAAGAAAFTTLAGCSGDDGETDNTKAQDYSANREGAMDSYAVGQQFKASAPLTFPIMMLSNAGYPYKEDWLFFKELTKRTNVTLQSTVVPGSDYNQKRSVLVSSGSAPTIIPKTYHPDEEAYIAGGAILAVSDHIDLMPNLKEQITKWNLEPDLAAWRQEDGKYYLLPGTHEEVWQDYSLAVRTDILQQLGLSIPKTWDDFHQMLKAMKQAHPDVYPLSDRWSTPPQPGGNNLLQLIAIAYGSKAGWGFQHANWDPKAKKFVYTGAQDGYKQMLQYLNTLVSEKLVDPESFTQSDDQAKQKFANGKSFVMSCNAQTLVNEIRKSIATIPGATVLKIPVPLGPSGAVLDASRLESGVMISAKARESKNFVALMQFIDWLWYSPQGKMFAKYGIEGQTYTGSVDDGTFKLAPDVNIAGLNPAGTKNLQTEYGFFNGVFVYGGTTKLLNSQFSKEEQQFQEEMNKRKPIELAPAHPLSAEEREQVTLWETGLKDTVYQQTLKFILGTRPLSEWDAYVGELKSKNMDKYIEVHNTAYERYKKAHG
ncbi:extracellular solute-binding protein [Dactylosporangium vinaceum]|uniref:Extracellular solute-binding protein n=1 Tax=Dactylosporangium vinaceum TaxID=53362 RepID=A0ABV5MDU6_9ACTN|nr:extracellular solute-binding protein [Dactylosporangium vinaceum]UAC01043.1 extracellular solute-binding protein [Dactylosporangium vinaceum]